MDPIPDSTEPVRRTAPAKLMIGLLAALVVSGGIFSYSAYRAWQSERDDDLHVIVCPAPWHPNDEFSIHDELDACRVLYRAAGDLQHEDDFAAFKEAADRALERIETAERELDDHLRRVGLTDRDTGEPYYKFHREFTQELHEMKVHLARATGF